MSEKFLNTENEATQVNDQSLEPTIPELLVQDNINLAAESPIEASIENGENGLEEISSEDFNSLVEITQDVESMNAFAVKENASTTVRANAIANAFYTAGPEEFEQMEEAQAIVAKGGDRSAFTEWVSKKGRGVIASMALVAGMGAFAQNANAAGLNDVFKSFGDPTIQKTVNKIGEGVNASNRLAEINRKEQSLRDQKESLENQKKLLIEQAESNQNIQTAEVGVDSRVKPLELEAKHKEQKAQLELKKEESKKQFLAISNPTSADLARYEATQSKLNADMARIDGQYQLNTAKTEGRLDTQSAKIGVNLANANRQIHSIEMQQARIDEQIRNLNVERLRVFQRAGQVISR